MNRDASETLALQSGALQSSALQSSGAEYERMDYRFQPKGWRSDLGWYDRGYIPHFDGGQVSQFLTFRLFDSLPQSVIRKWREETSKLDEEGKTIFRKNVERYLDKGYGSCLLKDERVAKLTEDSLLFHHTKKYDLVAWVIMPNHIHFLARPLENVELSAIAHSIKSYTAHEANKVLCRRGQFWQHEPFDRYIRNRKHFISVIRYIENNPVKAGLAPSRRTGGSQAPFTKRIDWSATVPVASSHEQRCKRGRLRSSQHAGGVRTVIS